MNYQKWKNENTESLAGKTVAITGSTGGIGKPLSRDLVSLGAHLLLLDRNRARSMAHKEELLSEFPDAKIDLITVDLEDIDSVFTAIPLIKEIGIDVFLHNAGAYSIPRKTCKTGYDNVFQINFISPYTMIRELLPTLRERKGRVAVVGSIAHNYSKIDENDVDFATRKAASKVYGNAKRFLMFSLYELFCEEKDVALSVVHPGITFTNITAHYPKVIYALIKHPMKVIFMPAKKAALSVLYGIFHDTPYHTWIGPRVFDIWGLPTRKMLRTCKREESRKIHNISEKIYQKVQKSK